MKPEKEEHLKESVQALRDQTTTWLQKLVQIKSYSGEEKELVEYLVEQMKSIGFTNAWSDSLGNAVGQLGNGPVKIMYDAHIDTVKVTEKENWPYPPFEGRLADGAVYGRGAVDEKPAMAGFLAAAKAIVDVFGKEDLPFTLYVVGSVMEEDIDGYPLLHLIEKEGIRPDFVVLGEPTDLTVYRGQRGRMELKIIAHGKSAHGAHNEKGINAVYKLVEVVREIARLDKELPSVAPLGKGSVTVSQFISKGPSLCSVPDFAEIHLDRRMTVGETRESVIAELQQILDRLNSDAEIRVPEYRGLSWKGAEAVQDAYFPTWVLEEEHVLVRAGQQAAEKVLGQAKPSGFWKFSTNGVATAGRLGIPTIGFAPGLEELAHSDREMVKVADLHKAAEFYAVFPFILAGLLK